jgi:hypothetical protein
VRLWLTAGVVIAVWLVPQLGDACAVCFSARDENRQAFTITTAFLTALPLLMVGSLVFWLRGRFHQHDQRTEPWLASESPALVLRGPRAKTRKRAA